MAEIIRYVNPASTGGNGTTNNLSGANAAYASFDAWNDAEVTDLVTDTDTHVVNCAGSTADTVDNVQMTGWTTGVSNFVTINGDNTTGAWSTGHYRIEAISGGNFSEGILFSAAYTVINDFQISMTTTHTNVRLYSLFADFQVVNRCIAKGDGSGSAEHYGFYCSANEIKIYSSLAYDFVNGSNVNNYGFWGSTGGANDHIWYNCTAHNCYRNFFTGTNDVTVINCLSQVSTGGFQGGFTSPTSDYNGSDIASDAPGTNATTGDVTFVDEGGDDFQPASGDTVAKDNGTDLSGTFDFDLAGNAMPGTWPIGCLQAASGSTVTITDVNTTESWDDGDTGLVITGTGFV